MMLKLSFEYLLIPRDCNLIEFLMTFQSLDPLNFLTIRWRLFSLHCQVTAEYIFQNGACIPQRVHTVVVSVQHSEKVTLDELRSEITEKVVKVVIPEKYLDENTIIHVNPCGNFIIGGPQGDAGLTGRKIIVDTYGGWGAHGGGAFSGKDFTKVDRSAAYAARWVAKSLVKSGICRRCLVQVSYAIGLAEPLSITVFDYGTSNMTQKQLLSIVKNNFDLRPGKIVKWVCFVDDVDWILNFFSVFRFSGT